MGKHLAGRGEQRGDFLTASKAEHSFTVLVEIKKPSTKLIAETPYRQRAHMICGHLAGGVAQLQSNCRNWEIHGTRDDENRERLDPEQIHTVSPKGILIIGTTTQLDSVAKRTSFELFRRNLRNPEIITFDELIERAKHLLLNEEKNMPLGEDLDTPF
ncbi:MAG: Shedu immune nuclease family protein [Bacteroidota bacterium]